MPRALNKNRPYGQIYGLENSRAFYEQDYCYYTADGEFVDYVAGYEKQAEALEKIKQGEEMVDVVVDGKAVKMPLSRLLQAKEAQGSIPPSEPTEDQPAPEATSHPIDPEDADRSDTGALLSGGEHLVSIGQVPWPALKKIAASQNVDSDDRRVVEQELMKLNIRRCSVKKQKGITNYVPRKEAESIGSFAGAA